MDLYKGAYFGKSFMMIGDSLKRCFRCSYCRANDNDEKHYTVLPSEINPLFKDIPVAVNIFYGDPLIQIDNTVSILRKLEEAGHQGPVIIITKGDLSRFPKEKFSLDLHFGLSTFGTDSEYDGGSLSQFEKNMDMASSLGYKYSVEFRPLIYGVNDSPDIVENIFRIAKKHETGIGYCGLQVNSVLEKQLSDEGIVFHPYPNKKFGMKKSVSDDVNNMFCSFSNEYGVPVFKKTSCLIAWKHNLERDPNAHYYRPNEVGCNHCPMKEKCMKFKDSLGKPDVEIPFEYIVSVEKNHACGLVKLGLCKFPSKDCMNLSGKFIRINEKITTTDVRLIKWLTGFTVIAEFEELPYMSNKWIKS